MYFIRFDLNLKVRYICNLVDWCGLGFIIMDGH